jgi:AraC-like DNA-binding protein
MIATPTSFAETPERSTSMEPDVLSEMLRAIRLNGSVFLNGRFTAPFGLVTPKHYDDRMPMGHLRHASIFHLIASGTCMIETASGARHQAGAGDILLIPFANKHKIWNGDAPEMVFAPDIVHEGPVEGIWTVDYGGGGAETRIICGFVESSEILFSPLFRTLPELLVEHTGDDRVGELIASTVREIMKLITAATPGTQIMLGRMMELLFVEVLRRHMARMPEGDKGWIAALNDPIVGRALHLVHANPARRWTADSLAREAGTSRTVLAERFNALLGRPPIEYVTSWRIQIAGDRLRSGQDSIAGIAAEVGYESEAAFNRAFKRITGVTPGRWREGDSAASIAPGRHPGTADTAMSRVGN